MCDQRTIQTVHTVHQTDYFYGVAVERADLGLAPTSWVWAAINAAADRSDIRRLRKSDVQVCLLVLESLKSVARWRKLSAKTVEQLAMEDVVLMFSDIETQIGESSYSTNVKHKHSVLTRSVLKRYLKASAFPKSERISVHFKPKLVFDRSQHRKLISDSPLSTESSATPPLGATRHENIADLRRKTEATLLAVLEKIGDACRSVLDAAEKASAGLKALLQEPVDQAIVLRLLTHSMTSRSHDKTQNWAATLDIQDLAHAYLHVVHVCLPTLERASKLAIIRQHEIDEYLRDRLGIVKGSFLLFLHLGSQRSLLACLLLIQRHTKWNVNSSLELTESFLSGDKPPFEMHSVKRRTNTLAPTIVVEKGDSDVLRAIAYIRARLRYMKELKWLPEAEGRLWLNGKCARSGKAKSMTGWGNELAKFRADFGLPDFSLEQMRVQTLALEAVQHGTGSAQLSAGHQSIGTTGVYIDQLLLQRLNSSVNLEFQLRIEAEIIDSDVHPQKRPLLLFPVGDGSSCEDPSNPPFDEYLKKGACDASRCHSGGGCPNNKIKIDRLRVDEAVRTSLYYGSNWNRLHEQNTDTFVDRHLPNMMFNFALLEVLKRGRYGHLVRAAARQIDELGVANEK